MLVVSGCSAGVPPAAQSPTPAQTAPAAERTDQVGNVLPPLVDEATWARLVSHPIDPLSVAPGQTCPKSGTVAVSPYFGPVGGPGPVYVVGNTAFYTRGDDGTLRAKVAWISRPEYTGPALIRGRRIDAPGDVRFMPGGGAITSELHFEYDTRVRAAGSEQGWRFLPSTVLLSGTGCYEFQIDGLDWSVVVVMDTTANP